MRDFFDKNFYYVCRNKLISIFIHSIFEELQVENYDYTIAYNLRKKKLKNL